MVEVQYPAVTVSTKPLVLTYGTGGAYPGFDRFGRIKNQKWEIKDADPANVKDQFQYGYDRALNRTWREVAPDGGNPTGFDEYYTYDGLHRLERSQRGTLSGTPYDSITSPVKTQDFGLEALGNWKTFKEDDDATLDWDVLDQTRLHNKVNEIDNDDNHANAPSGSITGGSWILPVYDAAGNMTAAPKPGTETTRHWYIWDAWNRLVAVWLDDGDGTKEITGETPDDTLVATYRYDGLGRRIQKVVEGDPDVTYDYYYSGYQVVEVRKDGSEHPYKQYVWGIRYVHSPVLRWRDGNTDGDLEDEGDDTLYYTNDANFNVTALVEPDGDVVERVVYDPYGQPTFYDGSWENHSSTSAYANDVLYTGHRLDSETGLYYCLMRYYHPTLGRWMTRDPIGYGDGMSLYEYVGSSPITRVDPAGLWWPEHPGLTKRSFNAAFPEPTTLGGPKCRAWILRTLTKSNVGQDKKKPKEGWRHYTRSPNDSAEAADRYYGEYLTGEEMLFDAELQTVVVPCDTAEERSACKSTMEALGRLAHSWQDYFGHAVKRNGSPNAWSEGLTGTPDDRNPDLMAPTWKWPGGGQHGGLMRLEPAYRDHAVREIPQGALAVDRDGTVRLLTREVVEGQPLREDAATAFVADKLKSFLERWYVVCECCCPP